MGSTLNIEILRGHGVRPPSETAVPYQLYHDPRAAPLWRCGGEAGAAWGKRARTSRRELSSVSAAATFLAISANSALSAARRVVATSKARFSGPSAILPAYFCRNLS